MDPALTEEEERFMRWLEAGEDVCGHEAGHGAETPPHWLAERREMENLGSLLRRYLPPAREPPNPARFGEDIRKSLD